RRVAGIALEHFDRHWAAVWRTHQAVDDLQLALLAVAIVTEPGEFAAAPLQIARRHVVEHQRAVAQMLAGKRLLDRALALRRASRWRRRVRPHRRRRDQECRRDLKRRSPDRACGRWRAWRPARSAAPRSLQWRDRAAGCRP